VFSEKRKREKIRFWSKQILKDLGKPFLERNIHREEEFFNRFSKGNPDFQHLNKSMA